MVVFNALSPRQRFTAATCLKRTCVCSEWDALPRPSELLPSPISPPHRGDARLAKRLRHLRGLKQFVCCWADSLLGLDVHSGNWYRLKVQTLLVMPLRWTHSCQVHAVCRTAWCLLWRWGGYVQERSIMCKRLAGLPKQGGSQARRENERGERGCGQTARARQPQQRRCSEARC